MIETPLAILPLDRSFQEICDWFEFHVLSSEYHCASFSELARIWDKRRNSEDTDFENSESMQEDLFLEEVNQIIRERMVLEETGRWHINSTEGYVLVPAGSLIDMIDIEETQPDWMCYKVVEEE